MADIDELAAFNNQSQANQSPDSTASNASGIPSSPIDELKAFNDQNMGVEQPSLIDRALNGVQQGFQNHAQGIKDLMEVSMGVPAATPEDVEKRKAYLESILSGATLGASRVVEAKLLKNQEDQQRRAQQNEEITDFGSLIGNAGIIAATGGLEAPVTALGIKGTAKAAIVGAGEATALTAGNLVSDQALGDPDLNAQKLASALYHEKGDLAFSAILGGTLGVAAHSLASAFNKNGIPKNSISDIIDKNQINPDLLPKIDPNAPPLEINPDTPLHGEYEDAIKKTNIAEMEKALAKAKELGIVTELPQKNAVIDAESRLRDLQLPLNKIQVDSLDSQGARDQLGIMKQLRMKGGGTLADFEAGQKAERLMATDNTIRSLAPEADVTDNFAEAGQRAIKTFSDNYQAVKEAEGPIFEQIKQYSAPGEDLHIPGVIKSMVNKVPGVAQMFDTTGEKLAIRDYNRGWGISPQTYEAVKSTIQDMEQIPSGIKELMSFRDNLDSKVNIFEKGSASAQIMQLKAGMMDYIQQQLEKVAPNIPASANVLRNAMKNWAINEQQREVIERAFGASVGSPEFKQISRVNPEKILDKIFSDTAHVKAAKQILNEQQFNELLANYLAGARKSVTKDGVFSSNNFYSKFLNKKQFVLGEAMSDPKNSAILQRINDLNTTMRNFPDSGPTNTSKTGGVIAELLKNSKNGEFDFGSLFGNFKELLSEKGREILHRREINEALEGKPNILNKIKAVSNMTTQTDQKIEDGIRAILMGGEQFERRQGPQQ